MENYIRFDWAMKRLLRNKANYAVLEGLRYLYMVVANDPDAALRI